MLMKAVAVWESRETGREVAQHFWVLLALAEDPKL